MRDELGRSTLKVEELYESTQNTRDQGFLLRALHFGTLAETGEIPGTGSVHWFGGTSCAPGGVYSKRPCRSP
jgi:hypothetical protein